MAKRRRYKRNNKQSLLYVLIAIFVSISVFFTGYFMQKEEPAVAPPGTEDLSVHYIDVGQGDAVLITAPSGENMLIDAGPGSSEDELITYLDELGLETIDYFVLTHPDEDHIGGADLVFSEYTVSTVILPDCPRDTKAYENMENAITAEKCERLTPELGQQFSFCEGAEVTILAPISEKYADINDYSVVLRLDYYETSFLFTGDAHDVSEMEMIEQWTKGQLDCDVLKVGHHGSSSSSSLAFLKAVTPELAVISCAEDNKYGHPHDEVMDRLKKEGVTVYRTDLQGTVIVVSDGKTAKISEN